MSSFIGAVKVGSHALETGNLSMQITAYAYADGVDLHITRDNVVVLSHVCMFNMWFMH